MEIPVGQPGIALRLDRVHSSGAEVAIGTDYFYSAIADGVTAFVQRTK